MRILTSVNNSKISPFSLFAMLYISRLVVSLTHVQSIMAGKLSTQMLMSVGVALVLSLLFADRKSTRLNSSHVKRSRMPSSA